MNAAVKPTPAEVGERLTPATGREHLVTVACGLWMTIGLFVDGYFHENLEQATESFITPWHAVFYAGFTASALWIASMARRRDHTASWQLRHLPAGYGFARLGLLLFAVGGAGDLAWHTSFGVEKGVDALLSPTHLILFLGLVLILSAPFRAARAEPASPPKPWMIVTSVISATALVGFFLNWAWGLGISSLVRVPYDAVSEAGEPEVIAGVASMVVTTAVLFGAARLILSTGPAPAGAFALLFGAVALLVSVAFDEDAEGVGAAVAAGAALDVLLRPPRAVRSSPQHLAVAFGAASTLLWVVYLGLLATLDGIEWQPEIWIGAIVLNTLAAYAMAALPTLTATDRESSP